MVARIATRLMDYGELMKPRITFLALVTTFSGCWLAAGGLPEMGVIFFVLIGTALGASASSTLNNYVDRDLDRMMSRTENRCLPDGRVHSGTALLMGLVLGASGVAVLAVKVNVLSAGILLFTILFYILVYTRWLKRTSPLSTEIGGIAGSMPPVLGWAAVEGSIGWEAAALFAIMFVWQPPHFWALAIYYLNDYRNAGLPRLPVVHGTDRTKIRIGLYTALLLPVSLAPYFLNMVNETYLIGASLLGLAYGLLTVLFIRQPISKSSTLRLFTSSNLYLLVLFLLMLVSTTT